MTRRSKPKTGAALSISITNIVVVPKWARRRWGMHALKLSRELPVVPPGEQTLNPRGLTPEQANLQQGERLRYVSEVGQPKDIEDMFWSPVTQQWEWVSWVDKKPIIHSETYKTRAQWPVVPPVRTTRKWASPRQSSSWVRRIVDTVIQAVT